MIPLGLLLGWYRQKIVYTEKQKKKLLRFQIALMSG